MGLGGGGLGAGPEGRADAEAARAALARRTRRLAPGAETQTHLHGEAVEGKWLEACGVEHWVDAIGYDG